MLRSMLSATIAAVESEGAHLLDEFHRARGPRGQKASAAIDTEIEDRLRASLQAICPCRFGGEETGTSPAPEGADPAFAEWLWLVDPQDGTYEFLQGRRGSSVSVALLRGTEPVLAVVHSPLAPDLDHDTVAWAEGLPSVLRNGKPVEVGLAGRSLSAGELVIAPASSAIRPQTWSRGVSPARYVAMPSIAYRLARVAAGDGAATLTIHPVNEYDIAAGYALVRAAGGVVLDAAGQPIFLRGDAQARVSGCLAGAPEAVQRLLAFDWKTLEHEARLPARIELAFPRRRDPNTLSRAQGALLGLVLGAGIAATSVLSFARALATGSPEQAQEFSPLEALLRAIPAALLAGGDAQRAAQNALADSSVENMPTARDAITAYAAALACGVAGAKPSRMLQAALENAVSAEVTVALKQAAARARPRPGERFDATLAVVQNAFYQLLHASGFEQALQDSRAGPDGDVSAGVAAALYCAASGKEVIPPQRILQVLADRPASDDVLEIAEKLLA